ncbi:uncharacterized protein BDR25DRAFT_358143 [Lindgomyces ingoldianus]|uniref:Uncharacterized protein n=1 Tax=Lindgomyces ingoldianus TaxID=673940 RepID=A0ACB6QLW1_9PLEO|nr:uncharacterized protein BDR25DRAFT_358143 [Lindgomyces ingoldianus]KAF2467876.1 hypothetical protein BDR25DRAFT_358143 [Lindgomyces ingoldianus]
MYLQSKKLQLLIWRVVTYYVRLGTLSLYTKSAPWLLCFTRYLSLSSLSFLLPSQTLHVQLGSILLGNIDFLRRTTVRRGRDVSLTFTYYGYVLRTVGSAAVSNSSGALSSGRGLGEPKFYVNETRFNGDWGRPQRDGPALRATALITEAKERVWPVAQNDLNYVARYWNDTGCDLWEEIRGSSFFTTAVQHRALVEGSALAQELDLPTASYNSQASNILCFLQTFWNGRYAIANINTAIQRTGIDANTVLTFIATFDPEAKCDNTLFQPCSSRALESLYVYFGGNPWYLTTLAVAEQPYDAIQQWRTLNTLTIADTDLSFWQMVYPSAETGTYEIGDPEFNTLLNAVLSFVDKEVEIVHKYLPSSGALAEQYSRENGTAFSARDLTWSYASYVTMRGARLAATSNYAQASSAPGTYTPAVAAGAPPGAGGCTIIVTFNVNATTFYGEKIYLTGNTADLGNWSASDALSGSAVGYTDQRPLWSFELELPGNSSIDYKYLRKEPSRTNILETTNRTYSIPVCANQAGGSAMVEDAWVDLTRTPSRRLTQSLPNVQLVGLTKTPLFLPTLTISFLILSYSLS